MALHVSGRTRTGQLQYSGNSKCERHFIPHTVNYISQTLSAERCRLKSKYKVCLTYSHFFLEWESVWKRHPISLNCEPNLLFLSNSCCQQNLELQTWFLLWTSFKEKLESWLNSHTGSISERYKFSVIQIHIILLNMMSTDTNIHHTSQTFQHQTLEVDFWKVRAQA